MVHWCRRVGTFCQLQPKSVRSYLPFIAHIWRGFKNRIIPGRGGAGGDKQIKLDLFLKCTISDKLSKEQMVNLPRRKTTWIPVLSKITRADR